uniref:forkhead box protein N4 isoform X1 n=1 Tax=Podarcis muralis TaxID=64176 RepID=UPI00109F6AFA|nr:forkhead box protein N4 isoform X1 [Podarcis muralis]XP_028560987.1 forkhead box protein N4 isoform X1 [Podarcis muralis]XP_028560988.1 forkhead box protein N4 isoform X1 [Podarcis muralis]
MIESDINSVMSGLIRNSGQSHHPSPQEYRLLASDPSQLGEDDLPGDLQSLSWLTSVDVPRLQQMASERMDFGLSSHNAVLQQTAGSMPGNLHATAGTPGAMIHIQASLPQGILGGLNTVSSHGANQISQYVVGGQLSPSLQAQAAPLFPPLPRHVQQVFTIAQHAQQCPPTTIYSTSYGTQPQYSQPPRLAPHSTQEQQAKPYPKPIYSYSCLIAMALKNSKTGSLPVSEIYSFMKEHFPYFKTAPDGWKNSVRHNLSLNKCFEKVENKMSGTSRKGCLWALNPAKIDKMEEEMQKWKRKDLAAILRSMANPEELDKLITDRPESCRRLSKQSEGDGSTRSHMAAAAGRISHLQPQPVMTLALQSLPLHHQIQTQACMTPDSPAPAQTPPLHPLHALSQSPLPQHPMSRAPDFLSVMTDMNAEVDALDPSIMDFALQGNIWEEMKDESFTLESLGAFSNSSLALSDCDLAPAGLTPASSNNTDHPSFSDLQVTGLYTTYTTLDPISATQYISAQGNKPIALL